MRRDVEGDPLTATNLAISAGAGTLVDNGDGTWTYTPALNDDTAVSFSYTITDGTDTVAGSATLDITPVNDAPTTSPVTLVPIAEDSGARIITQAELLANASDIEGDTLTATNLAISAGNGTLVDNGDGTWTYTPALNDDTAVSFSYTITDGTDTVAGSASLDITPVNDAPTTTPVTLAPIAEDSGPRIITQAELLANASDIEGDSLKATGLAISAGAGTLVDNGDGTWTYTPALNDDTAVSFSYSITDGTDTVAGSATLDITPVNDAPTTSPVTLVPIAEDSGARIITQAELLANASDIEGDSLTATGLAISAGAGTLVDNGDGTWTYTPALNDDTAVSFSYTITDGTDTVAGSASLDFTPVNDAPTTTPVTLAPIAEDSGARLITQAELLVNASDIEGDALTATNLAISAGAGTLVDNGDGTWTYTPALNDDTAVSFSYTITDGIDTVAGSASLDITPVNDAPIHNVPATQSTSGNTPLIFSSLNGNSITIADPDASGAAMEVTLSASNGTLSLAGTTGLSFTAGDGSGDVTMTFMGTAADINTALNGLIFQPDLDYQGTAAIQIITDDLGNAGTGGALNAMDQISISVVASAPTGIVQNTLPPLDQLIEDTLDLPAREPVLTVVKGVYMDPAAEEPSDTGTPGSESATTKTAGPAADAIPGLGRGVPTQADVSLSGSVALVDQNPPVARR